MQSFNDYEEVPVIPNYLDVEPIPPPLPPPRCASLVNGAGHQNTKPLPMIPCSVSAHELDTDDRTLEIGGNHIDRPLPPLPRGNSLKIVSESASSSSNSDEDDDNDADDKDEPVGSESSDLDSDVNMDDSISPVGESFDADATLPPSPTEKINTSEVIPEKRYVHKIMPNKQTKKNNNKYHLIY